jgi:RNA polymerase-interacting CarD/CdnL/TRCF family regulator
MTEEKSTTVRIPTPNAQERMAIRSLTPRERLDAMVNAFRQQLIEKEQEATA